MLKLRIARYFLCENVFRFVLENINIIKLICNEKKNAIYKVY